MPKDTIAIIGAAGKNGSFFSKRLSNEVYRLLLMDKDLLQLDLLFTEIKTTGTNTDVDLVDCCRNASWEADVIIVAVPANQQAEVAVKIKEVATQKIVIFINCPPDIEISLQNLLSQSKLVYLLLPVSNIQNNNLTNKEQVNIKSIHADSLITATKIISSAGIITRVEISN